MAVQPAHGKGGVVLVDEFDMRKFLQNASLSASMDPPEKTTFADNGDRTFIAGLRDATFACDGIFSASTVTADNVATFFGTALGGSTKHTVTLGPAGASTGARAFMFSGDLTKFDVSAPFDDIVKIVADIQASSGYKGGRWLKGPTTSTSTGSGGTVNAGGTTAAGGTTGGAVGHLHVWAERNVVTATFRIQHSTSGSTWLNLISFTAATGVTFQRSTVAGTVKEKVRATLSGLTEGATGGSISWAVAMSRYGTPKK